MKTVKNQIDTRKHRSEEKKGNAPGIWLRIASVCIALVLLIMNALIIALAAPGAGEQISPYICNWESLITEEQEAELCQLVDAVNEKLDCSIMVISTASIGDMTGEDYVTNYIESNRSRIPNRSDTLTMLLYQQDEKRKVQYSGTGYCAGALSESGLSPYGNEVSAKISNKDHYSAFRSFILLSAYYVYEARVGTPISAWQDTEPTYEDVIMDFLADPNGTDHFVKTSDTLINDVWLVITEHKKTVIIYCVFLVIGITLVCMGLFAPKEEPPAQVVAYPKKKKARWTKEQKRQRDAMLR